MVENVTGNGTMCSSVEMANACADSAWCLRMFDEGTRSMLRVLVPASLEGAGESCEFIVLRVANWLAQGMSRGEIPLCDSGEMYRMGSVDRTLECVCSEELESTGYGAEELSCDASRSIESHTVLFGVMCVLLYQSILLVTQLSQQHENEMTL